MSIGVKKNDTFMPSSTHPTLRRFTVSMPRGKPGPVTEKPDILLHPQPRASFITASAVHDNDLIFSRPYIFSDFLHEQPNEKITVAGDGDDTDGGKAHSVEDAQNQPLAASGERGLVSSPS